jgi:hypothetical protein
VTEAVVVSVVWLLPLAAIIYLLVLLTRIADGVQRIDATLDRRLGQIQRALAGSGGDEGRWPPEE